MTFDYDLCVLFLYHKCDPLTRRHLEAVRASNPGAFILPLTDSVPELLPGSVDVGTFPSTFGPAQKWRGIDATLYRWFERRAINARRYVMVEYDCFCNVDLAAHYGGAEADVIGVDYFTQAENPRWKWFRDEELSKLPSEDRAFAAGIVPLTCTMFSHAALDRVVTAMYRNDVFCELRLGTVIRKLGLNFQRLPLAKRSTICWHTYPWRTDQPGLFHGVKSLDHNQGKSTQPGKFGARIHDWLRSLTRDREFFPFHMEGRREGLRRRLGGR